MDAGIFLRTPAVFAAWISVPLLLIILVVQGTRWYCLQEGRKLQQQRALMELLPDMMEVQGRADGALADFVAGGSELSRIEDWNLFFDAAASTHGLRLNSVRVTDKLQRKGDALPYLAVDIDSEGGLPAMMQFIHLLQQPRRLITVEAASIRLATSDAPQPMYAGKFSVRFHRLPSEGRD